MSAQRIDEETIRSRIRKFVLDRLDPRGVQDIAPDDSLVASGVVDSLGVFQLVAFLEESFAIRVKDQDIRLENFETIEASVDFVRSKLALPPGFA